MPCTVHIVLCGRGGLENVVRHRNWDKKYREHAPWGNSTCPSNSGLNGLAICKQLCNLRTRGIEIVSKHRILSPINTYTDGHGQKKNGHCCKIYTFTM